VIAVMAVPNVVLLIPKFLVITELRIDGAGTLRIFWSIVLPMARPAVMTIVILSFQGSWNEFGHVIVASSKPDLYTLTKGVAQLASGSFGQGSQYPIKLVMTIPVAVVFFVFQKRIMNISTGAVKE
jgi:multiple sugar transport system permease protein